MGISQVKKIDGKLSESKNPKYEYAKELGQETTKAVYEALAGLGQGASLTGEELNNQTKKILKKKYGDDVINTLYGEGQPEKK